MSRREERHPGAGSPPRAAPVEDAAPRKVSGGGVIRVLAVDHTAAVPTFRKKFDALAALPDVDLTVLAPRRWIEGGSVVTPPSGGIGYDILTGNVVFPGYENRGFYTTGVVGAVARARPHVLDLYEEAYSLFFLQCAVAAKIFAPKAKIVFHASDSLSWDYRYPYRPSALYATIERYAHRVSDCAITINDVAAEILRSKGFDRPIRRGFHGVDENEFRPEDESPLIERLGLSGPVVGYLGRLMRPKGVHVLIDAVSRLSPVPDLLIVGSGEEEGALKALARERGVGGAVHFVPHVRHEEVPPYLNALDVMVLPSIRTPKFNEPFGRVLVEAMSCGVPVIGTTCGSMELVLGDAGIIVPEDDAEALAGSIKEVLGDDVLRSELSRRGRERALSHYTWPAFADAVHEAYIEVLGS
jgi:glycosyltransferase involved in cell wall biosynthesis